MVSDPKSLDSFYSKEGVVITSWQEVFPIPPTFQIRPHQQNCAGFLLGFMESPSWKMKGASCLLFQKMLKQQWKEALSTIYSFNNYMEHSWCTRQYAGLRKKGDGGRCRNWQWQYNKYQKIEAWVKYGRAVRQEQLRNELHRVPRRRGYLRWTAEDDKEFGCERKQEKFQ